MPIPRLRTDDTVLLVIDLQDRLLAPIPDRDRVVANASILMKAAGVLGMPFLVTEFYPQRLGRSVDAITAVMSDPSARLEKTSYSAQGELLDDLLRAWRRTTMLVCGIEAPICVLQTVLDLQQSGRQCFVASDAIGASQPDQIGPACRRWEAAGAITTGVASALMELMGDVSHPGRREIVDLVRQLAR